MPTVREALGEGAVGVVKMGIAAGIVPTPALTDLGCPYCARIRHGESPSTHNPNDNFPVHQTPLSVRSAGYAPAFHMPA